MIFKKFKKHLTITWTRLNQKNTLSSIAMHENETLKRVVEAFSNTKNFSFTREDKQAFERCESIRSQLLQDETVVSYDIFGSDKRALVKDICKIAASSKKECQFLYALTKVERKTVVLEMGTNVGISGCYILEGIKNESESELVTMEGLPQLCKIAEKQFSGITSSTKFDIKQGLFGTTFPAVLRGAKEFNLLFIDGNHQKEPTIDYFMSLKNRISSPAILVFDDINWSIGMKEAWEVIKKDPDVNYVLDFYRQGIVIIDRKETAKNVEFKLHLSY